MKKLLLGALPLVAGASWAGTTLYSGSQSEAAFEDFIAQLNQMSGLSVRQDSWQSGFLESTAVTSIAASDAAHAPVLFRLQHSIGHSPIRVGEESSRVGASRVVTTPILDDLSEEAREHLSIFTDAVPITVTTDVGFDGKSTNVVKLSAIAFDAEDGEASFVMDSTRYEFSYEPDGALVGTGSIGGMSLTSIDGSSMSLSPGEDEFVLNFEQHGLYSGTQKVHFDTFTMNAPNGMQVVARDLGMDFISTVDDQRLASRATFSTKKLESPLPIDHASFSTGVSGLDTEAFAHYMALMSTIVTADPDTMDEQDANALLEQVGEFYKTLFGPGAGVQYALNIGNDSGAVDARLDINFEGDGSASGFDAMATVGDLVRALNGKLELDADKALVAMTPLPMFLADPQMQQFFVEDGESLRTRISVDDLIVDINGNPLSLEMMLGDTLGMPLDISMFENMD